MSKLSIRVVSDLHLEAFTGRNAETLRIDFIPHDPRDAESVLVLAGDISSSPTQLAGFIQEMMKHFKKVIFIPGNHEYYKHNYDAWNKTMAERFDQYLPDLHYAFGDVRFTDIDGVRFIFGTLWGDGGPTEQDRAYTGFYLNDFRLIERDQKYAGTSKNRNFSVQDMMTISKAQKGTIKALLEEPFEGRKVVVTHHLPSRRLVSERFKTHDGSDGANGGFVTDCDNMICVNEPELWIHGHTHDTIDTMLWKTRVVCNPLGYRGEWLKPHNTFLTSNGQRGVAVPKFVEV